MSAYDICLFVLGSEKPGEYWFIIEYISGFLPVW
jgi:hypothetical protein